MAVMTRSVLPVVRDRLATGLWSPLSLILLTGCLLRLALWLWFEPLPIHIWDEGEYHQLAVSLAERGEFAYRPGVLTSHRPPLYPSFVALVYKLFGVGNVPAVRLLQAGLSLATVYLVYDLGRQLYGRRVGLLAGGLYCFYPSLLVFNNLLLTEPLFNLLLCASF